MLYHIFLGIGRPARVTSASGSPYVPLSHVTLLDMFIFRTFDPTELHVPLSDKLLVKEAATNSRPIYDMYVA